MKKSDNDKKSSVWLSNLHIDDGWMGGGGQSITHPSNGRLSYSIVGGDNNDLFDYKGTRATPSGFFDWNRKNIFHYCLIVHDVFDSVQGDADGYGEGPWPTQGQGTIGGDDFLIQDVGSNLAELFMHELGHNLGLTDKGNDDKAMKGTGGYSGYIDYTSNDWNVINSALVQDTTFSPD